MESPLHAAAHWPTSNGSATLANGHDTSTVVQLQDIQEQQDPIVVADEETALWPNIISPLDCLYPSNGK